MAESPRESAKRNRPTMRIAFFAVLGIAAFVSLVLSLPSNRSSGPTVDVNTPGVELAGVAAFNRGDYATAIPLLQEASYALRDSPGRRTVLQKMMRIAQRATVDATQRQVTASADPATTQPTASRNGTRTPHPAPAAGQVREMAIKDLGNFDYDSINGGGVPDDVTRLSGSRVRLTGYMMPLTQAKRVTQFDLMPSLYSCCFSQPPGVEHTIHVTCAPDVAIEYSADAVVSEGILTVAEKREDGIVTGLFTLNATSVKPATK